MEMFAAYRHMCGGLPPEEISELVKAKREGIIQTKHTPLTIAELCKMHEEIVWCAELECWGIVIVETGGTWDGKPFLLGHKGCQFEYDIEARKLTLYRHIPSLPHPTFKMVTCPKGWQGTRYTRYHCPGCKKVVRNDEHFCHKCGQGLLFPKEVYDKKNNKIWLDFSCAEGEAEQSGGGKNA